LKTTSKNSKSRLVVTHANVGFFRRLAVILYDSLLLIAILFLAAAVLLPLNAGDAVTTKAIIIPYYLVVSFGFYGWFWTRKGQTAGLKTWKLRLITFNGQPLTWKQALIRFLAALLSWGLLGLGFLWILMDKNNYALHDYLSKTCLVSEHNDLKCD
jgi:uncharacterized RDD family membrane protein YckC